MTAISDFCETIRGWLNLGSEVYPDPVVTSWVRMAEETLSKELRCKDMVQIDVGTLVDQRYLLPADWRELDFVRQIGERPLRYVSRDDFYNPDYANDQKKCYTLAGNYIIVGSTGDRQIEIHYYQDLPPLSADPNWVISQYPTVLTLSTLKVAAMYAIEDERQPTWNTEVEKLIATINDEHRKSKYSGSLLTARHRRSFG